ncbi:Lipoprotein [Salmonella enterica subsp. arizonae]|uniref:Lipoprotein n=1 Tax=Salmonella enterica subsp. arizonae TaxID=59203 RepID=A0A379RY77_SALER|nr:Lipoprotein [Salmonella enterica subsp. arizonae]
MATGKSCSRWFAPVVALLMVFSLSGCFDKEGDQRKAFVDFLQNTAMRSGERLPTLTADQKKQFGPFVSDYAILYGYSQQVNQAMDSGLRPVVDSVNAIRVPQDYMTQREPLRQANGSLGVLAQQLQNAKLQADAAHGALKQTDELKPVFDQVYKKVVTVPADALQPLIPAAQIFTPATGTSRRFYCATGRAGELCRERIQFPTSQQASQYNALIGPLASQHQAFNQAWTAAVNATQ